MPCNCGKAGQAEQWAVTLPDGTQMTASNEVQARQWIARAGGGVMKKVPAKT